MHNFSVSEKIQFAALAARYRFIPATEKGSAWCYEEDTTKIFLWRPLVDNKDSFDLLVRLGLAVFPDCSDDYDQRFASAVLVSESGLELVSTRILYTEDSQKAQATREAIFEAAYEIGRRRLAVYASSGILEVAMDVVVKNFRHSISTVL
jgi:hypothetical protein